MKPDHLTGVPLIVITGLSGAGKSTAMRFLEDLGCYCVDNLPPALIPDFFHLYNKSGSTGPGVVIACDVRSGALFEDLSETAAALGRDGIDFNILYLDCDTDTLAKRFSEVRRRHPLQVDQPMKEAIEAERHHLAPIRSLATWIIDTSGMNAAGLREALIRNLAAAKTGDVAELTFLSFGFKYGIPLDMDFVFDARFLKNPHYEPDLRRLTGHDAPIYNYVMSDPLAPQFLEKIYGIIDLTLDPFVRVGKTAIAVGVGCTGGRHRSVTLVRALFDHYEKKGSSVRAIHRDAAKPPS
ncbi:MAG: RNase adapter RapZ [Myxococcota bacterium]|nr:RNase adapter RapZ [Myxococcota bacterium]